MKYDARACKFNMDTSCVELLLRDGRMISIDCTGVEDVLDVTMAQRSELDYLIYNDPLGYADLILNGDPEEYLKNVTGIDITENMIHEAKENVKAAGLSADLMTITRLCYILFSDFNVGFYCFYVFQHIQIMLWFIPKIQ